MIELDPIKKNKKSYPLSQIELDDTAFLGRYCAGFIHGGKLRYLKYILAAGRLQCSDNIRAAGKINLVRDTNSKGPDGQGCYFRFMPSAVSKQRTLQTFTGPGAAGGFFMFMPTRNVAGLSFFTMGRGDYKYSVPLTLEKMMDIATEVRSSIRAGTNNSEIAFYKEVPLSKITEIYIAEKKAKPGTVIDRLLIRNGYSPDRGEGKTIQCWRESSENGYVNYLIYYRTGAAVASPSAPSLPGLYESPSRQTEGRLAAKPASKSGVTPDSMKSKVVHLPSLYGKTHD